MKPLHADQTIRLTHTLRQGTASTAYSTLLSGVSCREVQGATTGARSGSGTGFASTSSTGICIFVGHSTAVPEKGAVGALPVASNYLAPQDFKAAEEPRRACHWTVTSEDKVLLPSGRTGTVTSVQDNRAGRCPHWYLEVSG